MIALQRADSHSLVCHWKQTLVSTYLLAPDTLQSAFTYIISLTLIYCVTLDWLLALLQPDSLLEPEYLWPRLGLLCREEGRQVLFVDPPSPEHKLWFRVCTQSMCR